MASQITIRRSPIVLIRTLVSIEVLGFLAYSAAAALGNYEGDIYGRVFLSRVLSYHSAKFMFLSAAQLVITIYAFLRWYYEQYEIKPGLVSHEWGVFVKKWKIVSLERSMTAVATSDPLGKLFHYGTILIK
ncbi:MAG: PH domain-containing protein, partial [Patescibacteria group bacterium]